MPMKIVTVRRFEVVIAFVVVTAAFILGLVAFKYQRDGEKRDRVARIALIQKTADDSCSSRHLLAEALRTQNSVIRDAEARAIDQTKALQVLIRQGKATDPYPPGVLDEALKNALRLVDDLNDAAALTDAADCHSTPRLPKS